MAKKKNKNYEKVTNPIDYENSLVLFLNGEIGSENTDGIISEILTFNKLYSQCLTEISIYQEYIDSVKRAESEQEIEYLTENNNLLTPDDTTEDNFLPSGLPRNTFMMTKNKRITLVIDSPGGCTSAMRTLIGVMESSILPVDTVAFGDIASAASTIFLYGKKRYLHKDATILFHDVSYMCYGDNTNINREVKHSNKLVKRMMDTILNKTTIPKDKINDMVERRMNWIMFGDEAVKYNVATHLIV